MEQQMPDLSTKTTLVVGASRGLGRGIAMAFAEAGAPVVAVARTAGALTELTEGNPAIVAEVADAREAAAASSILDRHEPEVLILVAGASPLMRALQHHTWETFSVNWDTDVRIAFHWLREALLRPLPAGSRVIVISSGAALAGSPLSGGYAGAKATQRFITGYAQDEADRAGLDITFTAVLPKITPLTDLGRPAVLAYAARSGQTQDEYLAGMGALLTPQLAGEAMVRLVHTDSADLSPGYLLTGAGLQSLT
jgi:NAD(P)-dependent dehydrogenase (short-subunit alcohol dehydrogenase family)